MSETGSARPALRVLIVALAAFVMLGLIDGAVGVAWPSIRDSFGRSLADLGLLLAFGSIGYLGASIGYGWFHARLGTGSLLAGGSLLLVFGAGGVAAAPVWWAVTVSAVVLGLGGGLVDTGMNAHAALAFDVGSINLLHASYGVGATLGPVVISASLIATDAWRGGYGFLAGLQALSALAVWARRDRWFSSEQGIGTDVGPVGRKSRMWFQLVLFFLYTGAEVAAGQWAFTLLTEGRGVGTSVAGLWVSSYWAGLTVGRFGFGVVGGRLAPSRILSGSMVVSLLGTGLLWLDPFAIGAVGLPIAGLGLAAIFPTLVSVTPARIGRFRSTRSMGFQLAAANIGGAGIPWILGITAEVGGLETLGAGLFITVLLLTGMNLISERV